MGRFDMVTPMPLGAVEVVPRGNHHENNIGHRTENVKHLMHVCLHGSYVEMHGSRGSSLALL
jgi:hypothetical protein